MHLMIVPLTMGIFKKGVFQAIREKETRQTRLTGFRNESLIQESFRNGFHFFQSTNSEDSGEKGRELLKGSGLNLSNVNRRKTKQVNYYYFVYLYMFSLLPAT